MTFQEISKKIKSRPMVVTYFSHDECNVCKVLRPQVKEVVNQYENIEFMYVNTKHNPEVSGQHMVFAVPTIIIFYEGREAKRYSRHLSVRDFQSFLERMAGSTV